MKIRVCNNIHRGLKTKPRILKKRNRDGLTKLMYLTSILFTKLWEVTIKTIETVKTQPNLINKRRNT